jgi:hypothetical protein
MGFHFRSFMTLLFLVMGVVIFGGLVLLARVALEMVIVTFRIAEDLRILRSNTPGLVQPPVDEAVEKQD